MTDQKQKPEFDFSLDRDKGSFQFKRGEVIVLELVEGEPIENFMVRLCDFMNRDRRPVVYLEDHVLRIRGLLENALYMLNILHDRMAAVADKKCSKQVSVWIKKSEEFISQIKKEAA